MMHRIRRSLDRGRGGVLAPSDYNNVQIKEVGTAVVCYVGFSRRVGLWNLAKWSLQLQGDRPHQEDRFIVLAPGSLKSNKDIAIFAVFDGQ